MKRILLLLLAGVAGLQLNTTMNGLYDFKTILFT